MCVCVCINSTTVEGDEEASQPNFDSIPALFPFSYCNFTFVFRVSGSSSSTTTPQKGRRIEEVCTLFLRNVDSFHCRFIHLFKWQSQKALSWNRSRCTSGALVLFTRISSPVLESRVPSSLFLVLFLFFQWLLRPEPSNFRVTSPVFLYSRTLASRF